MRQILLIILTAAPLMTWAQMGLDSVLMNERTIDRPIIVHDRQLRVTPFYNFATLTSRFDENGDKIKLSSDGTASILQNLGLDIRYGWKEMLQLNIALNYVANVRREQPVNIISSELTEITQTQKMNGLEDLFVGLDFLVPWQTRKMDLLFSGGVSLPTAKSEPDEPGHNLDDASGFNTINYVYNNNRGLGVIKAYTGTQFKYRLENFAFSVLFRYGFPIEESESLVWDHRLNASDEFEYQSRSYAISHPDTYLGLIEAEYQLYPWIALFLHLEQQGTVGGWTEETGNRIAIPEQRLTFFNPGVEILLTPKIWFRQRVVFAVSGENAFSPFSIQTSLLINSFPF